ncbi:MAG: hypothetical protein U0804_13810 [Gemmataceae bacterium]
MNWLKNLARRLSDRPPTTGTSRKNRSLLNVESMENRLVPATLGVTKFAVLDFDGDVQVTKAEFTEGGWSGLKDQAVTSFANLFTSARPWLNRDGDGDVDLNDFARVRDDIVAKVRQDYAPYDVDIFVGDQDSYQGILTDSVVGDAMVFVTGGTDNIAAQIGQSPGVGWAPVDLGNAGDQMGFVFGQGIADSAVVGGNYDRFVNWMARTISHELGHTFGLAHIDTLNPTDAQTHHTMNTVNRDFSRDFGFQDQTYETAKGPQNSHQLLRANLGDSTRPWAAVLRPGVLTVHGSSGSDWLTVRPSGTYWRDGTTVVGPSGSDWQVGIYTGSGGLVATYHVDPSATPDINSINPFSSAIQSVAVHGGSGDDRIEIGVTAPQGVMVDAGAGNDVVFGGPGVDYLYGGADHDILVGGGGNDYLYGEGGRDILIGGAGSDHLYGGADDNVLVGGDSTITGRLEQLTAMRADWTSTASAATRKEVVKARFGLFTFADTEWDSVYGGTGVDLFFLSPTDENGATSTDYKYLV